MTLRAILRIVLGLIFVVASLDKALNPSAFAAIIYNYGILPDSLINAAALFLPWLELLTGICLIFDMLTLGASGIALSLMCVFLAALGYNALRGLDIACGCFSTQTGEGGGTLWSMARDAGILVLAAAVFRCESIRARSNTRLP